MLSDVGAVGDAPTEARPPSEGGRFNIGFGEGGHGKVQGLKTSTLGSRR